MATFNVQHGRARSGAVDVDLLASACAALRVDLLGLQEVERGARRSGRRDLPAEVGDACGMAHHFAAATRLGWRGRYGNALLVRGTIADVEELALPRVERHERRTALLARAVVAGGEAVSAAVTHLSHDRAESAAQLAAVLEALVHRPAPRVLLGDLNRRDHEVDELVAAGFTVAGGPPTYPAGEPRLRIDHVAVDGLTIADVVVPEVPVSDHRPLVVELGA